MSKITKIPSLGYRIVYPIVSLIFRLNFTRRKIVGVNNIPKSGSLIFTANHQNALNDALSMLVVRKHSPLFVARADIFKKKIIVAILHFLRIRPINRIRDGKENLLNNDKTNNEAIYALAQGIPFAILPEGNHRPKKSLQPLVKGVFRIAIQTLEQHPTLKELYIVPVGLDYSDFTQWGGDLFIKVGEPISVIDELKLMPTASIPEKVNHLKSLLVDRLKSVMVQIEDNVYYDAILYKSEFGLKGSLEDKFNQTRERVAYYNDLVAKEDKETLSDLEKVNDFIKVCKKAKIAPASLRDANLGFTNFKVIAAILLFFPYFLCSLVLNIPIWGVAKLVTGLFKDESFHNSLRVVVTLVFPIIIYPIYIIIAAFVFSELWAVLLFSVLLLPSWWVAGQFMKLWRGLWSNFRLIRIKRHFF